MDRHYYVNCYNTTTIHENLAGKTVRSERCFGILSLWGGHGDGVRWEWIVRFDDGHCNESWLYELLKTIIKLRKVSNGIETVSVVVVQYFVYYFVMYVDMFESVNTPEFYFRGVQLAEN